jgi:hypothetical protein
MNKHLTVFNLTKEAHGAAGGISDLLIGGVS